MIQILSYKKIVSVDIQFIAMNSKLRFNLFSVYAKSKGMA